MNKVELRPAFEWTCDDCGIINFSSLYIPDVDELDQIAEDMGIPEDEICHIGLMPDIVTCKDCNSKFETKEYNE